MIQYTVALQCIQPFLSESNQTKICIQLAIVPNKFEHEVCLRLNTVRIMLRIILRIIQLERAAMTRQYQI